MTYSMREQIYKYNDIDVNYMFKVATSDKRHLIVIFTGFGEQYSFINVGQLFKCNVLWIKDDYAGTRCYYLGKKGKLDFAEAANSLISSILDRFLLSKSQCTFIGGSKGGFAALYLGIEYQYPNIISAAPSTRVGSHMKNTHKRLAPFVMNGSSEDMVEKYDNLLLHSISKDLNFSKNIYLFLSEDDGYYADHQEYLIQVLRKYNNFNLVKIASDLVYQHNRITLYSVPLIISFTNSLIEGIVPRFGYIESGQKIKNVNDEINLEPVNTLRSCKFEKGELFIDGVAFFQGLPASSYGVYRKKLLFVNKDVTHSFVVGTVLDKSLGAKFFKNSFIDYSAGGFANLKGKGIDLSDISIGVYQIMMSLQVSTVAEQKMNLLSSKEIDLKHIHGEFEYRLWIVEGSLRLSKRKLLDDLNKKTEYFGIRRLEIENSRLFIAGDYAILGVELQSWGAAQYYLILSNSRMTYSFRLGMEDKPELNSIFNSNYGVYQKSCFATLKHKGIDLSEMQEDKYDIDIVLSYKGTLFQKRINDKLYVQHITGSFLRG